MKYLSFVRSSEKYRDVQPPAAMMEAMGKLIEKFTKQGALVDTGGLAPSRDGFRMRLASGKLTTTDGPFSESKEVIGGWAILQADSKAEILRFTREFMELHRTYWPDFEGECEVRPIEFLASEAHGAR
ncbi:MAG TPA: YciI family protein [Kofleriaceae bacterium]|nr:YciI family protein [Kofleriaceae bacterium]